MSQFSASVFGTRIIEPGSACPPQPLTAYGDSDVGMWRDTNEDSFGVLPSAGLFMVADGMGGNAAGEVASRITVQEVRKAVGDNDTTWPADPMAGAPESGARRLMAGVHRANRRILAMANKDSSKKGMGTTFAGILLSSRSAMIAHVGDSRVYRLRDGLIERLTEDHTFVNALVARGLLTSEDAAVSPQRHILTRAVGVTDPLDVDVKIVDTRPGDVFLLSSDGLHNEVTDIEIEHTLKAYIDPEYAVMRLIQLANEHGGRDNITAVVVRLDWPKP